MAELLQYLLRHMHVAVEPGQNFRVADEDKVTKRRGIADKGNQPRAVRKAAMSRSKSSSV